MKRILIAVLFCISSTALFAQKQKTIVYSTIGYDGRVDYGDLNKLLPDTLATKILIDPRKVYNMRRPDHVLLWMTTNGWKLVGPTTSVLTGTSFAGYLMSKDIYLDTAAYSSYKYWLMNIEQKKK